MQPWRDVDGNAWWRCWRTSECVLAYVPVKIPSPRDLRLSVLVLDGDQLVVTSVRVNPEPVLELALREARRHSPRP